MMLFLDRLKCWNFEVEVRASVEMIAEMNP